MKIFYSNYSLCRMSKVLLEMYWNTASRAVYGASTPNARSSIPAPTTFLHIPAATKGHCPIYNNGIRGRTPRSSPGTATCDCLWQPPNTDNLVRALRPTCHRRPGQSHTSLLRPTSSSNNRFVNSHTIYLSVYQIPC